MITRARNTIFIILFTVLPLSAQENDESKTYVFEGDKIRYTEFYPSGQVLQTGYFLKGKNHGIWTSYNQDGTKKAEGTFENGKKVDAWFFWNDAVLIEVIYKNNSIQKAIQWDKSEVIALKDD